MTLTAAHLADLAEHAASIFDGKCVEQFAALCLRTAASGERLALLITSRETKRWVIPKGWPIKGLLPHEVAEREAWEEAGVKGKAAEQSFGTYTYLKKLDDGTEIPAFVEVHVLEVRCTKNKFPERHERTVAWVTLVEAVGMVSEPELQGLFRKLAALSVG
ncbi:NUDIX hydrolase [Rhizobium viscosum]|uniref:8-oxo-dGTP pyrophosphatase MutT (NUDIX family) n=1 Tax=Rhizobium viscosum TaxID=1673 RepID=A0ABR9IYM8_RHIVS|nr:NUDIX hydrolase [Rhizobium viscosum]MBE1508336.1 8-oxo-dGTP pyrophosphatase MutT (NUDIX family) [Rhizobium viscosum]